MSDNNDRVNELRKDPNNRACFDCGSKGVNYVMATFGTFVCSACAGVLRELGFRAMGIGMSTFKDKDIEVLEKWGNKKAKKHWLKHWSKKRDPVPDAKSKDQLKAFLKAKYVDKKF